MKIAKLLILTVTFSLLPTSAALAVDEGNTKPRINSGEIQWSNTTVNVIPLTTGAGNIKGVFCYFVNGTSGNLIFTVDGATSQTITLDPVFYPLDSAGVTSYSGWIPMNIRFGSSIRVQLQHPSGNNNDLACQVSWALD
jgi:hypothetical protein